MFAHNMVMLPKGAEVKFPDACVGCGAPQPQNQMWVWTLDSESKKSMFCWLRVPACPSCALAIRGQQWFRYAAWLILFVGAVAVVVLLPEPWKPYSKALMVLLGGATIFLMFGWSYLFPKWFDFSPEMTLFCFRSKEAADAFQALNQPRPNVTNNPPPP